MLSPRHRRLNLDFDMLRQRFANWPLIELSGSAGMPPEAYRFTYRIKGLYVAPNGEILERDYFDEYNIEAKSVDKYCGSFLTVFGVVMLLMFVPWGIARVLVIRVSYWRT